MILLLSYFNANGTIYYVSNAGSDAANGTSTGTSWQTIAKVNASSFSGGDQILFNKGDTWNEKLIFPSSGSAGNVITIGSYGTGLKPVITGFATIAMNSAGGNIWTATASSSPKTLNTVLIDGVLRAKGRYPNYNYLTNVSFPSTSQLIVPHSATDYTGYGIAVRCSNWVIDRTKISSVNVGVTNDTFNFSVPVTYNTLGGYYFLQNHANLLDTTNEWSFDSTNNLLSVYKSTEPIVQMSTIDTLVFINNFDYLTFDGLSFTGGNIYNAKVESSQNITFQNCIFNNSGGYAVHLLSTKNITIQNDSIQNCLSNGVYSDPDTSISVQNNYIKNIGKYEGMGQNGNGTYIAIYNQGHYHATINNHLDSCGYSGIYWKGKFGRVDSNYVSNYCFTKQDGAGIYTFQGGLAADFDTGTIVKKNIIINGLGNYLSSEVYGLFNDDLAFGVHYDSNTVSNTVSNPLLIKGYYIKITGNTIQSNSTSSCLHFFYYFTATKFNYTVKNNIFYTPAANVFGNGSVIQFTGLKDSLEIIDSNYCFMPNYPARTFNRHGQFGVYYDLATWQSEYLYDLNSTVTLPPSRVSDVPALFYNPTLSDSTITFSGAYVDENNVKYIGSIDIKPYQSKLLFPAALSINGRIQNLIFE